MKLKVIKTHIWYSVKLLWTGITFAMPVISWIWTDDKTGKHSDTTMWRNLAGFPLYAVVWLGVYILYRYSSYMQPSDWFDTAMPFLYFLAGILGLTVFEYRRKRYEERFRQDSEDNEKMG
jgi:hypothetical protein